MSLEDVFEMTGSCRESSRRLESGRVEQASVQNRASVEPPLILVSPAASILISNRSVDARHLPWSYPRRGHQATGLFLVSRLTESEDLTANSCVGL